MSNRLFESVSAGALVICDENPFAKKFFGDSLLYIDSRSTAEQIQSDITDHLEWVRVHPSEALAMIDKAQKIFRQKFTLIRNLIDLYGGLKERKRELLVRQNPPEKPALKIRLNLLMPEYDEQVLNAHINSVSVQEYADFYPAIIVDTLTFNRHRREIEARVAAAPVAIELVELDFFSYGIHPNIRARRRLGGVFAQLLGSVVEFDALMFVAPNEKLFSNHLAVLSGALQRSHDVNCAATAAILINGDAAVNDVHEVLDFGHVNRIGPTGYGRFIFRVSAIPKDIHLSLPYLDGRPLAVLVGDNYIDQQLPASIVIFVEREFPERTWDDAAENEIIRAYSPDVFTISTGVGPRLKPTGTQVPTDGLIRFSLKLVNPRWVVSQIRLIRKQGISARLQVLKRKLGL
jgi:hypothetical protein